jgi:hypothetical protein
MNKNGGSVGINPSFLTSALDGDEWSFYPRENSPRYSLVEGWVGPKADLNAVEKRNVPHLAVQPVALRYTD